ncbi:hypothetical protein [Hyphomonas sp.]|uniref:hypothetical protein n=1 Tax=Hyphomonas sp. TaxID=87 RepID=UPI0025C3B3F1|nr:hypothetical protein [Hyphomonas sp.]
MIRLVLAAMLMSLIGTGYVYADTKDVYTIRNISVDETAPSVIEAREKAMAAARASAARQLINKITLASDRNAAGGVPVDGSLASRFTAAVDVEEETAGAGRYRGKLAVVLNPQTVRAHLDSLKVPYMDQQAPLALMVPVAGSGLQAAWSEAFGERNRGALVPSVTATSSGYTAFSSWSDISPEATPKNAKRGIIAELQGRDGAWRVVVSTVTATGNEPVGATPPAPTLQAAVDAVTNLLDESWKQSSIIRDSNRTKVTASVLFTSLVEWNTLRGALARSPLVSDFRTTAVAREGALVTFSYAGDENRLRNDLVQRGVTLARENNELTLRSAVSTSVQ